MKLAGKLGLMGALVLALGVGSANAAYRYGGSGYDHRYDNRGYDDYRYDSRHGYDDRFGGTAIIRCESRDGRTAYCGTGVRGDVRLVNQRSDRSCIRGRTWGTNSRGLWVTGGCRGDFQVLSGIVGRHDYRYDRGRLVRCQSRDERTAYCNVDTRGGVRLVNQLSRSPCIQGRSWGVSRGGLWVSRGCRGEFVVGAERGRWDYGYRDGYRDYRGDDYRYGRY